MFAIDEKQWDELRKDVRACREITARLETLWNGGPGDWPHCMAHTQQVGDHEKRLRFIEERVMRAIGAVGVIATLGALGAVINLFERVL